MCNKFPIKVQNKANQLIKQYEQGLVKARRSHKCRHEVIDIGLWYRLLKKQSTNVWVLMSHEKYNKEVLRW